MEPTFYRSDDPPRESLPETFIDRYAGWAVTATDAPRQYHIANAVVMLSTVMSPYVKLETSYGDIKPNIWSMILAGTTVTRKSTTMDMAMRMLGEVHPDFMMGTDGSPEGIMSELALRDGKISLFHRDEITGWIDGTQRRDYLAGLLETFTRLYDGKSEKRILRREHIEIKDPNLVIMSGGIKTKMQEIMTMDHIRSGFLPRFIMVTGQTRAEDVRPIGPPPLSDPNADVTRDPREIVVEELYGIVTKFLPKKKEEKVELAGVVKQFTRPPDVTILTATSEAWSRIQGLKLDAGKLGEQSTNPDIYMPLFDRLSNSIIKVAMLICASLGSTVINLEHVLKAIHYSDQWLQSIIGFAEALESMPDMDRWERKVDKILVYMKTQFPEPVSRAEIMQKFRVKSRDVEDIEKTMIARGHIRIQKVMSQTNKPKVQYVLNTRYNTPKEDSFVVGASQKDKPLHHSKAERTHEPFYNVPQSAKDYWLEKNGLAPVVDYDSYQP